MMGDESPDGASTTLACLVSALRRSAVSRRLQGDRGQIKRAILSSFSPTGCQTITRQGRSKEKQAVGEDFHFLTRPLSAFFLGLC